MPGTATLTFSGTVLGLPTGQRTIDITYDVTAAIDDAVMLTLSTGDNAIQIPGGANFAIIETPPGNIQQILLKGSVSDTGLYLHPTFPMIWSLGISQTVFYLNTSTALGGPVQITFI